jgi:hypothetical protein
MYMAHIEYAHSNPVSQPVRCPDAPSPLREPLLRKTACPAMTQSALFIS